MEAAEPRTQDFATQETNTTTASSEPVNIGGANANGNADPFAAQRTSDNDPFANQRDGDTLPDLATSPSADSPPMSRDRRMSKEWDASKVPPSRFQKRQGSIYATPGSRDAHTGRGKDRDQSFHEKLKQKGWL
ncbi:MAG: hypothetical protein M1830_000328 [Pleopsidium flavum]|nr:MAG: hypothetical protein M1830_000328 [Pleopsidium flavum]